MEIQFNEAQLSRPQQQSLIEVLDVLQSQNENELVVTPVEFPIKLKVKLDDDIEMLLGWDVDKQSYAGLTKPEPEPIPDDKFVEDHPIPTALDEPEPEYGTETVDLPEPEINIDLDMAGKVIPPELVKSEIGQRVQALAQALINLTKPLDSFQRGEVWIQFCTIYVKGVME